MSLPSPPTSPAGLPSEREPRDVLRIMARDPPARAQHGLPLPALCSFGGFIQKIPSQEAECAGCSGKMSPFAQRNSLQALWHGSARHPVETKTFRHAWPLEVGYFLWQAAQEPFSGRGRTMARGAGGRGGLAGGAAAPVKSSHVPVFACLEESAGGLLSAPGFISAFPVLRG